MIIIPASESVELADCMYSNITVQCIGQPIADQLPSISFWGRMVNCTKILECIFNDWKHQNKGNWSKPIKSYKQSLYAALMSKALTESGMAMLVVG